MTNVASHGFLKDFLIKKDVYLHAMWFDIYTGEMYLFSRKREEFVLIDEASVNQLLQDENFERLAFENVKQKVFCVNKSL